MTTTTIEPVEPTEPADERPPKVRTRPSGTRSLFDPAIMKRATWDSFVKLDPRQMMRNPVMFIVEVVATLTTVLFIRFTVSVWFLPDMAFASPSLCAARKSSRGATGRAM